MRTYPTHVAKKDNILIYSINISNLLLKKMFLVSLLVVGLAITSSAFTFTIPSIIAQIDTSDTNMTDTSDTNMTDTSDTNMTQSGQISKRGS